MQSFQSLVNLPTSLIKQLVTIEHCDQPLMLDYSQTLPSAIALTAITVDGNRCEVHNINFRHQAESLFDFIILPEKERSHHKSEDNRSFYIFKVVSIKVINIEAIAINY